MISNKVAQVMWTYVVMMIVHFVMTIMFSYDLGFAAVAAGFISVSSLISAVGVGVTDIVEAINRQTTMWEGEEDEAENVVTT